MDHGRVYIYKGTTMPMCMSKLKAPKSVFFIILECMLFHSHKMLRVNEVKRGEIES